jgi:hypothetical protein
VIVLFLLAIVLPALALGDIKTREIFFQNSTVDYMTKTLNQIFFFFHQNQNIFFSNIGNQNIFLEKKP